MGSPLYNACHNCYILWLVFYWHFIYYLLLIDGKALFIIN